MTRRRASLCFHEKSENFFGEIVFPNLSVKALEASWKNPYTVLIVTTRNQITQPFLVFFAGFFVFKRYLTVQ